MRAIRIDYLFSETELFGRYLMGHIPNVGESFQSEGKMYDVTEVTDISLNKNNPHFKVIIKRV